MTRMTEDDGARAQEKCLGSAPILTSLLGAPVQAAAPEAAGQLVVAALADPMVATEPAAPPGPQAG